MTLYEDKFIKILKRNLVPYDNENFPFSFVFQQDNATYNIAILTEKLFFDTVMDLLT